MNFNTGNKDSILWIYHSKGYLYLKGPACYTLRDEMLSLYTKIKKRNGYLNNGGKGIKKVKGHTLLKRNPERLLHHDLSFVFQLCLSLGRLEHEGRHSSSSSSSSSSPSSFSFPFPFSEQRTFLLWTSKCKQKINFYCNPLRLWGYSLLLWNYILNDTELLKTYLQY